MQILPLCFLVFYLHQVITLEGWVDIMYYVQDAHSFYNFIYFILLIIVSIPLCFIFTLVNNHFLIFYRAVGSQKKSMPRNRSKIN